MKKLSTVVYTLFVVASAAAAPTANEDFVIAEDAQTFTNAVNAAKLYTDTSTNAAVRAAKRYTDAATNALDVGVTSVNGASGAVVIPAADFSTSNATLVATIEATAPAPGNYAAVSNAAMNAAQNAMRTNGNVIVTTDWKVYSRGPDEYGIWPDPVLEAHSDELGGPIFRGHSYTSGSAGNAYVADYASNLGYEGGDYRTAEDILAQIDAAIATNADQSAALAGKASTNALSALVPVTRKINGQPLTNDITIASDVTSVNGATGTVTLAASDVGAYSAANGAALAGQVATIGAHLNAEDARFVVTNYNSVTHTPEAYVEIQLPDTSWSRIWSEMTRWNYLFDYFLPTNYYDKTAVDAALVEKADRAWGFYDSTTGAYAPDGYTWISSEKIAIAANLAYQRTVTTEGAIWVLESNGVVTETGGLTNGFFRISDDEGNALFEIVKGNKRTIGADASSCQVVAGFTPTKLQIGYSVVSDVHPTLYVCESLTTQNWRSEDSGDCIANVSWSGTSGAYVAQVQGKSAYSSMFVKATYEVGGETYINNTAPVSMQYIMLNGVKYSVGTATISGNTVLTLTVAP